MVDLPRLVQGGGRHQLLVDGRPFLILGLQWGCDSCFAAEEMTPLFAEAARTRERDGDAHRTHR